MARNPNYPYDPYAGEVPMGAVEDVMTVGGIAREVTNPVNWLLWKYQYNPGTYSMSKGIAMPFGKNIAEKGLAGAFTDAKSAWSATRATSPGFFGAIGSAKSSVTGGLGGAFNWGEKYLGYKSPTIVNDARSRAYKEISSLSRIQRIRNAGARKRTGKAFVNALEGIAQTGKSLNNDYIQQRLLGAMDDNPKMLQKAGISRARWSSIVTAHNWESGAKELGHLDIVKPNKARLAGRFALKSAMFAGKMFAGVGLITTAWDVSKMVGEPIGRYLVENVNRIGLAYQNRFMPETGGKIAMSYMSSGAATERQRAIEAISKSYINGRSAIGNEAQYLHG